MQKTLRWILALYVLFALTDLVLTMVGIGFVGSSVELNPVIRLANPYVMVVLVKVFVIWVGFKLAKEYSTKGEITKFMTVSFLLLCAFLQLCVSGTNAYMVSKFDFGIPIIQGKAELVPTATGFDYVKTNSAGIPEKVGEVNPIQKNSTVMILFYAFIGIFAMYPMLFANITFWLKRKIDKETVGGV